MEEWALITIFLGRFTQFLIGFATLRIATTLLPPEEMGELALYMSSIAFFAMFLVNPVGVFINRRLHSWQVDGKVTIYAVYYAIYLLALAVIASVMLLALAQSSFSPFSMPIAWLLVLVVGSLVFNTVNQTSIPSLNLLNYNVAFVVLTVFSAFISLVFAYIFVIYKEYSAEYWLLGLLVGQTIFAFVGTYVLFVKLSGYKRILPTCINKNQLIILYKFAWPISIATGMIWVQYQGYRFIVDEHLGLARLGLFVAGYSISAGVFSAFDSVLTSYFQPRLYSQINTDDPIKQAKAWRLYAASIVPSYVLTVILIITSASELTYILLGDQFQSASQFVIWGAIAEFARVLTGMYSLIAHVYMRTKWLILASIIGALVSIILCLVFMPIYDIHAAGIGLAVAGSVVVILLHCQFKSKVSIKFSFPFVMKIFVSAIILAGVGLFRSVLLPSEGFYMVVLNLAVIGIFFVLLQYSFLHQHLSIYSKG